jgi:hypothetical protein
MVVAPARYRTLLRKWGAQGRFQAKFAAKCLIFERTAEKIPGGIETARSAPRNPAV